MYGKADGKKFTDPAHRGGTVGARGCYRTRAESADDYLVELTARAAVARRMVVPFDADERRFLDLVIDRGQIEPGLITRDPELQRRIALDPLLRWKAANVRAHKARQERRSEVPEVPLDPPVPG